MALTIHRVEMVRPRYTPGRALGPARVLVLHATGGSSPSDLAWLRKGGGEPPLAPVSIHYYIDKAGRISQLVADGDTAWHCGASSWLVDGVRVAGSYNGVARLNHIALGIELENDNTGSDPYPSAQYAAAVALARQLVARYAIPRAQLVRHLDIAPGRKTDPAGFPWPRFVSEVYAAAPAPPDPPPPSPISPDAPLLALPRCTLAQAQRAYAQRAPNGEYTTPEVNTILGWYWERCATVGLDPCLTVAQMAHETNWLRSALSQRRDRHGNNLRNPAGIGVTGQTAPGPAPGFVWDADRGQYRLCVGFAGWQIASVPAHVGRLLAYALKPGKETQAQHNLIAFALGARPLAAKLRGSAPTLGALGGKWSEKPGTYGPKIAAMMNEMRAL